MRGKGRKIIHFISINPANNWQRHEEENYTGGLDVLNDLKMFVALWKTRNVRRMEHG